MNTFLELADRVGASTGPDRELDADIGLAVGHIERVAMPQLPHVIHYRDIGPEHGGEYRTPFQPHPRWRWPDQMPPRDMVRPYTGLFDAALTLLEPHWDWRREWDPTKQRLVMIVEVPGVFGGSSDNPDPKRALIVAALRAYGAHPS